VRQPRPKACAFRQRKEPKITKEHAWPNWIRRLFPGGRHTLTFAMLDRPQRQWTAGSESMGVTVQDFCRDCNSGWMSAMEHDIAPLLRPLIASDAPQRLRMDGRQRHANWCYKTAVVFDLVTAHDQGRHAATTKGVCARLGGDSWMRISLGSALRATGSHEAAWHQFSQDPNRAACLQRAGDVAGRGWGNGERQNDLCQYLAQKADLNMTKPQCAIAAWLGSQYEARVTTPCRRRTSHRPEPRGTINGEPSTTRRSNCRCK
jgi:hypothetical protein